MSFCTRLKHSSFVQKTFSLAHGSSFNSKYSFLLGHLIFVPTANEFMHASFEGSFEMEFGSAKS